ncbi:MAG: translocation/assembly module TamB domain-containing protein [Acidobacteriota bacterium]
MNIKDGELLLTGKKISLNLLNFDLSSYSKGENIAFKLKSPHLKVLFPVSRSEVKLEGDLESEFIQKKDMIKINNFLWRTEDIDINGNGNIYKKGNIALRAFYKGTPEKILYPVLKTLSISGILEGNANFVKDKDNRILIRGKFKSPGSIKVGNESYQNMTGDISWNNRTQKIRINSDFVWNNIRSNLKVESKKYFTKVNFSNLQTSKALKTIDLYNDVPMGGIIENGDIEIDRKVLTGKMTLKKRDSEDHEFNSEGIIDIKYHTKEKWVEFFTGDAVTEFGRITLLKGKFEPKKKKFKIDMRAEAVELSGINKYLRKYVDFDLLDWNPRQGNGPMELKVRKSGKAITVTSSFDINNLTLNNAHMDRMYGKVDSINGLSKVNFFFRDRFLKGDSYLKYEKGGLDIDFKNVSGKSEKVLKILEIGIELKGDMTGNFSYRKDNSLTSHLIRGSFFGKRINFYDFMFDNVHGNLEVEDFIRLKDLKFNYHKGKGDGNFLINYDNNYFEADGKIIEVDINSMSSEFSGKGDVRFSGKGKFFEDPIKFKYNLYNLNYYRDREFFADGRGEILTDFSDYKIKTAGNIKNDKFISPFTLNFGYGKNRYYGSFRVDIEDINLLMPWENNNGKVVLLGEIGSDKDGNIGLQGVADLSGSYLSFPGFPHTLDNFRGSLFFKGMNFTLRSFSGSIGGGEVSGNGMLKIVNSKVEDFFINLNGKNMLLFPMERAKFELNANLNLKKRRDKFVLGGNINFLSLLWEREVDEGISFYTNPKSSSGNSKLLDNLEFDLKMKGKEKINVSNSFFRGSGEVDLTLTGNKDFPILSGSIDSRDGKILISEREFNLVKAKLVFNNKIIIDPLVRLEAETFIKNYRIKFLVSGLSSKIRPEFTSSPPMPTQDIIALISLGELFKRSSSTTISSEVGTTGLVTSALTDQIQRRVKKLFGIDMIKIDPDPTRSSLEGASRLTIGKSLTKDFLIVYSTDISRATRDVYFFQYQITPTITLIGKRNEEGRLSLDIRFRKRY